MTIFPNPSQRKLAGMCFAILSYIAGCITTSVPVEGTFILGIYTAFCAANYGEHKEKSNGRDVPVHSEPV